jgi:hypothetical protein
MPCPRFELHCREWCGALVICPRDELDIACADRVGRAFLVCRTRTELRRAFVRAAARCLPAERSTAADAGHLFTRLASEMYPCGARGTDHPSSRPSAGTVVTPGEERGCGRHGATALRLHELERDQLPHRAKALADAIGTRVALLVGTGAPYRAIALSGLVGVFELADAPAMGR